MTLPRLYALTLTAVVFCVTAVAIAARPWPRSVTAGTSTQQAALDARASTLRRLVAAVEAAATTARRQADRQGSAASSAPQLAVAPQPAPPVTITRSS